MGCNEGIYDKMKTIKEIQKQIDKIIKECGNSYGSVKSPRAHSKLMALEWVLGRRGDL